MNEIPMRAKLVVLMTCHNRRVTTLGCLKALHRCSLPQGLHLEVVLVDDGSTDGTAVEISKRWPGITILSGDGKLFWNRGMHQAFEWAMPRGYEFYLWINDDTFLWRDAINKLLDTYKSLTSPAIVVGCTCDDDTGVLTYGGLKKRSWWRPLKFDQLPVANTPTACDSLNGNCVLIPARVADLVGNLDWGFCHAMGDIDYALRARQLGIQVWTAPGFIGTCKHTNKPALFNDTKVSMIARLHAAMGYKNLPPRAWARFARRHAGPLWPAYWIWPYLRIVYSSLVKGFNRSSGT